MRHTFSRCTVLVLLTTIVACTGQLPPPPVLEVTSPQRGLVSEAGRITVKGTALPGPTGDPVAKVTVNDIPAMLAADGSFTVVVDVPAGASLLETVATSEQGAAATDARAVQIGQLRPVGSHIERAITAAVSADAFARLSAAAGPIIKNMNLPAMLAPLQPMASLGDDIANVKLSITRLSFGDVKIALTPVDGGLAFSAQLDALGVGASATYGGYLVPDGSTAVSISADQVTIAGTLVVSPAGTAGFTTSIASPTVRTTNLKLQSSGLVGDILDLLDRNLASTVQRIATSTAERALEPLINEALGAVAGPQRIDVLGKKLDLQTSPSSIAFSRAGALVSMNLQVKIEGSESSPGYVFTPNGTPTMDVSSGIQLGLADDLLNDLLAEVHALGLLDLRLQQDFGLFDEASFKLTMPPMISANTGDGSLRLVLGDMIATFKNDDKQLISAAVNAQVELAIVRGTTPQEIALDFGKVHVFVTILDGAATEVNADEVAGDELSSAANLGIGVQLDSLSQFLITVPAPSVAGVSFDSLSLRGDSGYVVVSGQIH